jgi:hypothetical protein
MVIMGATIRHYMNPLHLNCRLRDIGVAKATAVFLCRIYERSIFRPFSAKKTMVTDLLSKGDLK